MSLWSAGLVVRADIGKTDRVTESVPALQLGEIAAGLAPTVETLSFAAEEARLCGVWHSPTAH